MAQAPRALSGADVVTALITGGTVLPASVIPAGSGAASPTAATVPATATTLGGVKVGPGLLVAGNGALSVDSVAPLPLFGSPLPGDSMVLVRNGVPYLVPVSAFGLGAAGSGAATAFTTALSASSGAAGSAVTVMATPAGGAWPSGEVLTASASGLTGTFASTTASPTGTTPATFTFTPSAAGSGTLSVSASTALTSSSGAVAYQAGAAGTYTITNPHFESGSPAVTVTNSANGSAVTGAVLMAIGQSSAAPPAANGPTGLAYAATGSYQTLVYRTDAGALASGAYYIWLKFADGVDRLAPGIASKA